MRQEGVVVSKADASWWDTSAIAFIHAFIIHFFRWINELCLNKWIMWIWIDLPFRRDSLSLPLSHKKLLKLELCHVIISFRIIQQVYNRKFNPPFYAPFFLQLLQLQCNSLLLQCIYRWKLERHCTRATATAIHSFTIQPSLIPTLV